MKKKLNASSFYLSLFEYIFFSKNRNNLKINFCSNVIKITNIEDRLKLRHSYTKRVAFIKECDNNEKNSYVGFTKYFKWWKTFLFLQSFYSKCQEICNLACNVNILIFQEETIFAQKVCSKMCLSLNTSSILYPLIIFAARLLLWLLTKTWKLFQEDTWLGKINQAKTFFWIYQLMKSHNTTAEGICEICFYEYFCRIFPFSPKV